MPRLLLALLAAAVVLSSCGSSDEGSAPAPPQPASAKPADFPAAKGKTFAQLTKGISQGAILKISSFNDQQIGRDRFSFALVDRADKQLDVSDVAVYTADQKGSVARGPFVAHKESLDVAAPYRSALTEGDLQSGDTFYVANPTWRSSGKHAVMALARLDGRLVVAQSPVPIPVGVQGGPPGAGEKAIKVHTETPADVGGNYKAITTRIPPDTDQLKTDFADVLGKKPTVLLFATPALCQSRTCGPVVDITEQVRAKYGKGVTFIHQEIYAENNPSKGVRPQVAKWRLQSEPWAFVIDKHGKISTRFEGVFSVGELARAVAKVQ
ncbi:MAG: hypothetical protein QOG15_2983 [Solirubrobacteraceae bacterium]|jgi:hypothetical protein|nr:hypothetical protein [Solirubrobacteraceae bacterium]